MPIYEYECKSCHGISETVFRVSDYASEIDCFHCGKRAFKVISLPQSVKPTMDEYFDDNLDAVVTGRRHRKQLMKEQGIIEKTIDPSELRIRKERMDHNRMEELKNG